MLLVAITHVAGDPIKCSDIEFIVKDITHSRQWTLTYDDGYYPYADGSKRGQVHMFYDPNKIPDTPVIYVVNGREIWDVEYGSEWFGGAEYGVKHSGWLSVGDTVVLCEGNVTKYKVDGLNYNLADWPGWAVSPYWMVSQVLTGKPWKDILNRTDVPCELEITIIHIPTKSIIYTGKVMIH
jgi:hypothetical protein